MSQEEKQQTLIDLAEAHMALQQSEEAVSKARAARHRAENAAILSPGRSVTVVIGSKAVTMTRTPARTGGAWTFFVSEVI